MQPFGQSMQPPLSTMRKPVRLSEAVRREIFTKHRSGASIQQLARNYKTTRPTIRRWIKAGQEPSASFRDKLGRGRKPSISTAQRLALKHSAETGCTAKKLAKRLSSTKSQRVSPASVRRALRSGKYPLHWLPTTRGRTLSDANKTKRLEFCRSNSHAQVNTWVFVDAKHLYIYKGEGGYLHWRWTDIRKPPPKCAGSNPIVYFFYAAVAKGHKSKLYFTAPTPPRGSKLHSTKETFKSVHFIRVMKGLKKEVGGWYRKGQHYTFILDKAKQHTSKASKLAMELEHVHIKESFPPQSWDINIIENVWGVLDTKLLGTRASSVDGWRIAIKKAWNNIQQSTIDKLVAQVKPRMAQIVEREGAWLRLKEA